MNKGPKKKDEEFKFAAKKITYHGKPEVKREAATNHTVTSVADPNSEWEMPRRPGECLSTGQWG